MSHEIPLKDYLNSINLKQGDLTTDERAMKKYPAYVINKCLAQHLDTVMYANAMNGCPYLDNDLQYQFFLYSIRKSKRFSQFCTARIEENLQISSISEFACRKF